MVVCSGAGPIVAGPGPDAGELLAAVGNAEDYNLGVDLPVVIRFEGTPLQIETFKQLERHVSVDDPNFYIEDEGEEPDEQVPRLSSRICRRRRRSSPPPS